MAATLGSRLPEATVPGFSRSIASRASFLSAAADSGVGARTVALSKLFSASDPRRLARPGDRYTHRALHVRADR
ncbi:hypothetical protein DTO166G4_4754 [Paecilomyces variotii]|nr:hypothetical protein DTO166G4_4754 [Paecilomyces variotii]KAJ9239316.1 hypothetical protein DTO166G5_2485 [Paecilomyces variotii]KAJ9305309.1 hypothetical protein DTO217A2_5238 [Paecilomyces variotii]KAJ9374398.1 hypothetical protein DTO282E5_924 [Paecilomyces variotii]KAJ9401687.1 hypothetical protein DTO282F9_1457 [Paecilomyces variotii]